VTEFNTAAMRAAEEVLKEVKTGDRYFYHEEANIMFELAAEPKVTPSRLFINHI